MVTRRTTSSGLYPSLPYISKKTLRIAPKPPIIDKPMIEKQQQQKMMRENPSRMHYSLKFTFGSGLEDCTRALARKSAAATSLHSGKTATGDLRGMDRCKVIISS